MLRRRQGKISTNAGPSCTEMGRNRRNADDCVIEMPPVVNPELPRGSWTFHWTTFEASARRFAQISLEKIRFLFELNTEIIYRLGEMVYRAFFTREE